MRISFLMPHYLDHPVGGYRIVFQHANALASQGHNITILFPRNLHPRETLRIHHLVRRTAWKVKTQLLERPLIDWQEMHPNVTLKLLSVMREDLVPDGDAIIATAWETSPFVARFSRSKGRGFYFVQGYELWDGVDPAKLHATYQLPLRLMAISPWLVELVNSHGASDVHYVPNAIDFELFRVLGETPATRKPAVVCLYHESAMKNVAASIEVYEQIHLTRPNVPLTMFGVKSRPSSLPSFIKYIERPIGLELARLYNSNSIVISTSLKEGFGLTPAEAIACGCAFVGTDIGGFRAYCSHNRSALLSSPNDQSKLIKNLIEVIDNDALRNSLQAKGLESVSKFTWDRASSAMFQALIA